MHSACGLWGTIWKRLLIRIAARKADKILTVSEYSKKKMNELLGIAPERVSVVYNAWQHINRVQPENAIIQRLGLAGGDCPRTLI